MPKFYIIWNEARNEAFLTDDKNDAKSVVTGKPHRALGYPTTSTAGQAFHEAYDEETLSVEEIEIPTA